MTAHRKLTALLGASVLTLSTLGAAASVLAASQKVTICHATNSESNPYIEISVSVASSGYLHGGHADHTGVIWYPGAKGDGVSWGDIIPAYDHGTFHYAGLNVPDGTAILEAGCDLPDEGQGDDEQGGDEQGGDEPGPAAEAFIVTEVHLGATDSGDPVVVEDADPAHVGDSVHDSAALQWTGDAELPEGSTVTFRFFTNHACNGAPEDTSNAMGVSGASPVAVEAALPEGSLAEGQYSYMAAFTSGDTEVVANATGDCEPFTVVAFEQDQEGVTDPGSPPDPPNTATIGESNAAAPADTAWLLVVALGVLLASIAALKPAQARSRR